MKDFMIPVERVVRPIRAAGSHKARMREELLAHLTSLYEAELARLGDPAAARAEALRRFGDPADLTRELQAAVPVGHRVAYAFERWFGRRAPESAPRHLLRLARQT